MVSLDLTIFPKSLLLFLFSSLIVKIICASESNELNEIMHITHIFKQCLMSQNVREKYKSFILFHIVTHY